MATREETIKVEGMSCNHCKMAVEKALKELGGVSGANVDLPGKQVKVVYDPGSVSRQALVDAINEAGYQAS